MGKNVEIWKQPKEVLLKSLIEIGAEIRSDLTAILGYADLLLTEKFGSLTAQQIEYLNGIRQNAQSLSDMFTDHLHNHTFDKTSHEFCIHLDSDSFQFRTHLIPIWNYIDALLDRKAGPLEEKQLKCLDDLCLHTQDAQDFFEYLLDMYQIASNELSLKIDKEVELKQLIEQIEAYDVKLSIPDNIPKVWIDKRRVKLAIASLLNPLPFIRSFGYRDKKLGLSYDDCSVCVLITIGEFSKSQHSIYPNPSLFYCWGVIKKHGGQMQVDLQKRGLGISFSLPIHQANNQRAT